MKDDLQRQNMTKY